MPYTYVRPVFIGEDDASGLIFFPNYFRWMSEAVQLMWDQVGHPISAQIEDGLVAPTVHASCDMSAPARAGDLLTQAVTIEPGARTSFTTIHKFTNQAGLQVAQGRLVRVWVDLKTMRPRPMPEWLTSSAVQINR